MKPTPLSPDDFSAGIKDAADEHAIVDDYELREAERLGTPTSQAVALLACAHASAIRRRDQQRQRRRRSRAAGRQMGPT